MTVKIASSGSGAASLYRRNYQQSVDSFSRSLQRLSSRTRVDRPGRDTASLSAAARLQGRAEALGQAARNAAAASAIASMAEAGLADALKILSGIREKAKAAVAPGLDDNARLALHNDAAALVREFDQTVSAVTYDGFPLLNGAFVTRTFQVGASSGETMTLELADAGSGAVGTTGVNRAAASGTAGALTLQLTNRVNGAVISLAGITLSYNNTAGNGMAAVAKAINAHTAESGFAASAVVESVSSKAVQGGVTSPDFALNGVSLGVITVQPADADGRLVSHINGKTSEHGVSASLLKDGRLRLLSTDGRGIKVAGLAPVMSSADADMSTFGHVRIYQPGPYTLADSGDVTFVSNALTLDAGAARSLSLADITLTSRNDALDAVAVVDAATAELTILREHAETSRDQFTGMEHAQSMAGQMADAAKERTMEVDLWDETENYSRMKLLTRAGAFAMVQGNIWLATPLELTEADIRRPMRDFFASIGAAAVSMEGNAFFRRYAAEKDEPGPVVSDA